MGTRLFLKGFVTYGGKCLRGKAVLLFLLLAFAPVAPILAEPLSEPPTEPLRIVAFGDSLTHGYGLPEELGFVPQLQAWLVEQGADVVLINAGVSGDTTAGGRARIDWTLSDGFDAIIVTLGGNDLLRGIDPANSRANIEAILAAATRAGVEVLLVGMRAPGNYGPEYQAEFDALYPELAEQYNTLLFPSFFEGLGEGTPAQLLVFMQSDGVHPNAQGVTRIVKALGPSVLELIAQVQ